MAGGRPSAGKRARERQRQERQQLKAEKKRERADAEPDAPAENQVSEDEFMRRMQDLQERLDAGTLDIEAFQEERDELILRYSG